MHFLCILVVFIFIRLQYSIRWDDCILVPLFLQILYSIGWDDCILVVFFAFSLHSCTVLGGMIAFFCIFVAVQYWVG